VRRSCGILLHPTSLPSRGGIGDFGPAAYRFADWLAAARQSLWQVLPLHPLGYGNSPYSATSAFAGNPLLISLERLAEHGWLDRARVAQLSDSDSPVDYEAARAGKLPLLREAAQNFQQRANGGARGRFDAFCSESAWWLEDFVLFDVLRRKYNGAEWREWPREVARREPGTLDRMRGELASELALERVIQFFFFEQWAALRSYCHERGIRIVGDIAIFVNYDSADVWTHPDIFFLDGDLRPTVVAGVPPDAFSATGQRWGNPLYRWDVLRARRYDWWVRRMRWMLRLCDVIRLDHFRGFEKYWEIPASEPTAVHGRWVEGPKDELFEVLRRELGELPFIAEDLGFITPEVHALRQRLNIPGMRVMQFGFGDPGAHIYLPHKFEPRTVVYTGTHDNDTTLGWWKSGATEEEKRFVLAYFGDDKEGVNWAFIRAAVSSVAEYCIIPFQDVIGLGSEGRMNVPSRSHDNWAWRFKRDALRPEPAGRLATMVEVSDRQPEAAAAQQAQKEEFAA
jgi:4-alpha-glucanotransferase